MAPSVVTDEISDDRHKLLGLDHLRAFAITFVLLIPLFPHI